MGTDNVEGDEVEAFGFKRLTVENWLLPDKAISNLVWCTAPSFTQSVTPQSLASQVLAVQLTDHAPLEVRKLFEVAKGSLCYGAFFYPLYTLGAEQLFRVLDTALDARCRLAGCQKPKMTFADRIEWAAKRGLFDKSTAGRWQAARELRNQASHAERQSIYTPGMALEILHYTAGCINELFFPLSGNQR